MVRILIKNPTSLEMVLIAESEEGHHWFHFSGFNKKRVVAGVVAFTAATLVTCISVGINT